MSSLVIRRADRDEDHVFSRGYVNYPLILEDGSKRVANVLPNGNTEDIQVINIANETYVIGYHSGLHYMNITIYDRDTLEWLRGYYYDNIPARLYHFYDYNQLNDLVDYVLNDHHSKLSNAPLNARIQ